MKNQISSVEAIQLLEKQQTEWKLARENYEALKHIQVKEILVEGCKFKVQFNPARIRSSAAKIDASSLQERKCFLCTPQLPPEQRKLPLGREYWLMVNPFPIFPQHFTIPVRAHVPQRIKGRYRDLLEIAQCLDRFVLFYNGPKCGASAPDHTHFQAGNKGFLPIENEWRHFAVKQSFPFVENIHLFKLISYARSGFVIESSDLGASVRCFDYLYNSLEIKKGEEEPRLNLLCWFEEGRYFTFLFPRSLHRPTCYYAENDGNLLISPASVDMGGVFILPQEKDFQKITAEDIKQILKEVSL
ncbi:DUF4922 domain-containing protein [Parabacteroides pacaensis]|uniref:DUF4922 domain-containing protein n=1 Tax=Parabacteroides pacaensis TaxID=2086575 RepID=UPI000D0F8F82|nr:DUF4922 domain-containing protein [Parabacteroides pacaensis]